MSKERELRFSAVTCDLARHGCSNRGMDFVSCEPLVPGKVTAICREPSTSQTVTRTLLSGALGAVSAGAIAYALEDPRRHNRETRREKVKRTAAFGFFLGMLFGGYV